MMKKFFLALAICVPAVLGGGKSAIAQVSPGYVGPQPVINNGQVFLDEQSFDYLLYHQASAMRALSECLSVLNVHTVNHLPNSCVNSDTVLGLIEDELQYRGYIDESDRASGGFTRVYKTTMTAKVIQDMADNLRRNRVRY